MKQILILNTGSSSIKFKLFGIKDKKNLDIIKEGKIDRIGSAHGPQNHIAALSMLFQGFGLGPSFLYKIPDLVAIGHRVVHGGDKYNKTTLLNKNILKDLKKYNLLAPLHNPPILDVIGSILRASDRKDHRIIPNFAVFDTAFYKNLPDISKIYPLPYYFYKEHKGQP